MTTPSGPPILGRLAVHYKLISAEQLNQAIRLVGQVGNTKRLGEVMLEKGFITSEQLKWLVAAQETYLAKQRAAQGGAEAAAPAATPAPEATRAPAPAPAAPAAPTASPTPVTAAPRPARTVPIDGGSLRAVLADAFARRASDVHVHSGAPLQMRINGQLTATGDGPLSREQAESLVFGLLTPEQRAHVQQHHELDLALSLEGIGRFRGNVYRQQRGLDAVFRPIPQQPPTLESLGLPNALARLTTYHQGLVLVTGPAGCGKSSTLAALVNLINEERKDHILTIEDPIEYLHASKSCVVNQRQAVKHTAGFASALRAALREDPDIIVIGELRDTESISLAITAAETGHLVMGTLHTNNAVRTINRILDAFPPDQQSQIRAMVSESLRAIVSQRLVPTADNSRRVPALEVLYLKPAISNLIRDQKTFQIRSMMQTGRAEGMCLLDDSLTELVKAGTVAKEVARRHAEDPKRFA